MICPKCGKLLVKDKSGKIRCDCGYETDKLVLTESVHENKSVDVKAGDDKNRLAVHKHVCEKCGYDAAEIIHVGQAWCDEDEIVRYKCGKCGHVEQEKGKIW